MQAEEIVGMEIPKKVRKWRVTCLECDKQRTRKVSMLEHVCVLCARKVSA